MGKGGSSSGQSAPSSSSTSTSYNGSSEDTTTSISNGTFVGTVGSISSIISNPVTSIVSNGSLIIEQASSGESSSSSEQTSSSTTSTTIDSASTQTKPTSSSPNIVDNSYASVANANPGDIMMRGDEEIILTQGDIDWAKEKLEKDSSSSSSKEQTNTTISSPSIVDNSYASVANANPGDIMMRGDEEIVLTQGDIDWAKEQLEKDSPSSSNVGQTSSSTTSQTTGSANTQTNTTTLPTEAVSGEKGTTESSTVVDTSEDTTNKTPENNGTSAGTNTTTSTSQSTSEDKISKSIQENWEKQYNYDTGYRCDNWVEEVLNDAGYDSSEYLTAGKANAKTVQQHIDALTSTKTEGVDYTKTLPTKDGAYVVFMDDSSIGYAEHAAILVVENGVATLYDNSSGRGNVFYKKDEEGNVLKDEKGNPLVSYYDQGVASEKVSGTNSGQKIDGYGYETFYYQKIN